MGGPKLIIFDVDGTLVEAFSEDCRPGVQTFFKSLADDPYRPMLALATNQGGVGMRYWLETSGSGEPAKYPTQEEVELRLGRVAATLGIPYSRIYVCFAYRSERTGQWSPTPVEGVGDPRWSRAWRKPNPGMIRQAIEDAGVEADAALMVGDREEDERAARAAGCGFMWAAEFFAERVMA